MISNSTGVGTAPPRPVGPERPAQQAMEIEEIRLRSGEAASKISSVGATAPVVSSGGTTPVISIPSALYEGYEDVPGTFTYGTGAAALTYESIREAACPFKYYHFANNAKDSVHMSFQAPHAFDASAPVYPHLHVQPQVAPTAPPKNIHLSGRYCWTDPDTAVPLWADWTTWACDLEIVAGMEFKTHYVDLATIIPPAGTKGSAFLLVYCEHDGGAGTDTYTNNKGFGTPQATIALVGLDCHMKKIRIGSPTPAPI